MFEKIKSFYDLGLWTQAMVNKAIEKGIITAEESQEILTSKEVN